MRKPRQKVLLKSIASQVERVVFNELLENADLEESLAAGIASDIADSVTSLLTDYLRLTQGIKDYRKVASE